MLSALESIDSENEYILFSPAPIDISFSSERFKLVIQKSRLPLPGILWQQVTLPGLCKKEHIDILWGPEQTLPLLSMHAKKLLTVHDFVYKRYPETMQKSVLWINRIIGALSIKTASQILCVSNFTKGELLHFYPKAKAKALTVPCGAKLATDTPSVERSGNLLFIGNCEPRKNLFNLLKALEILHNNGLDCKLDIVGPTGWKNKDVLSYLESSPIKSSVNRLGFVSEQELRDLYLKAKALVFPSFYEGFGLPVLEALSSRTPVLTSKNSVMQELLAECALYFDPHNPKSIASTIQNFLENKQTDFYSNLDQKRIEILNTFIWSNSARQLLDILKKQ